MSAWTRAAAEIAARFEHGHAELTTGCALCLEEWQAVTDLTETLKMEDTP